MCHNHHLIFPSRFSTRDEPSESLYHSVLQDLRVGRCSDNVKKFVRPKKLIQALTLTNSACFVLTLSQVESRKLPPDAKAQAWYDEALHLFRTHNEVAEYQKHLNDRLKAKKTSLYTLTSSTLGTLIYTLTDTVVVSPFLIQHGTWLLLDWVQRPLVFMVLTVWVGSGTFLCRDHSKSTLGKGACCGATSMLRKAMSMAHSTRWVKVQCQSHSLRSFPPSRSLPSSWTMARWWMVPQELQPLKISRRWRW